MPNEDFPMEVHNLTVPSSVSAGSRFTVSVEVENGIDIPSQGGGETTCSGGSGPVEATGAPMRVDLKVKSESGEVVEEDSMEVCAPAGTYVPGVENPVATFDGLTVYDSGTYTVEIVAQPAFDVPGSASATGNISVSGSSSGGDDSDSGSGGGSVVDDVPDDLPDGLTDSLPDLDNQQWAVAGVVGLIVLCVLY